MVLSNFLLTNNTTNNNNSHSHSKSELRWFIHSNKIKWNKIKWEDEYKCKVSRKKVNKNLAPLLNCTFLFAPTIFNHLFSLVNLHSHTYSSHFFVRFRSFFLLLFFSQTLAIQMYSQSCALYIYSITLTFRQPCGNYKCIYTICLFHNDEKGKWVLVCVMCIVEKKLLLLF